MKKVMVTVLRHNEAAHEFFLHKLKYVMYRVSVALLTLTLLVH